MRDKIKKHNKLAEKLCAIFVPYVIESYGAVGKEADSFNKILANYGEQFNSPYSREEILDHITFNVAKAVQIGNHIIVEKGFQQAFYSSASQYDDAGFSA